VYLRLYQFNIHGSQRSSVNALVDNVLATIRAQNGCEKCDFFVDNESGNCGFLVFWSSLEAVEAAAPVIFPVLTPLLALATAAPQIRFFEICAPKE